MSVSPYCSVPACVPDGSARPRGWLCTIQNSFAPHFESWLRQSRRRPPSKFTAPGVRLLIVMWPTIFPSLAPTRCRNSTCGLRSTWNRVAASAAVFTVWPRMFAVPVLATFLVILFASTFAPRSTRSFHEIRSRRKMSPPCTCSGVVSGRVGKVRSRPSCCPACA